MPPALRIIGGTPNLATCLKTHIFDKLVATISPMSEISSATARILDSQSRVPVRLIGGYYTTGHRLLFLQCHVAKFHIVVLTRVCTQKTYVCGEIKYGLINWISDVIRRTTFSIAITIVSILPVSCFWLVNTMEYPSLMEPKTFQGALRTNNVLNKITVGPIWDILRQGVRTLTFQMKIRASPRPTRMAPQVRPNGTS